MLEEGEEQEELLFGEVKKFFNIIAIIQSFFRSSSSSIFHGEDHLPTNWKTRIIFGPRRSAGGEINFTFSQWLTPKWLGYISYLAPCDVWEAVQAELNKTQHTTQRIAPPANPSKCLNWLFSIFIFKQITSCCWINSVSSIFLLFHQNRPRAAPSSKSSASHHHRQNKRNKQGRREFFLKLFKKASLGEKNCPSQWSRPTRVSLFSSLVTY